MADQYYWVGTVGPFKYDDATPVNDVNLVYDGLVAPDASPIVSTGQIQIATAPTVGTHVLREDDIGGIVGDVNGPAGATDHAAARFDTATGKLLQNSTVIIDDSGGIVANSLGLLSGDATAARVLRRSYLQIENGTNVSTIKCTLSSEWNGDSDGPTDNVAKGATTGNYTLDAGGTSLIVEAAALAGDVVMAQGSVGYNATGSAISARVTDASNDIIVWISNTAGWTDMTVLVDTGIIGVQILYLTDA
jgi:hypothetical protein